MATAAIRRRARRSVLVLGVVLGTVLFAAVAHGDNLQNDAATTAGITTITAGDSTTITYTLVGNNAPNGDVAGCDADATHPVTVTITKPAAVSAPASISFTGCGNANKKTASFSSSTAGSYSITHAVSGGISGSRFNNNADFTLTVNPPPPPPNTEPSLTLPADKLVEATSASGAAVSYSVSASDNEDGSLSLSCSPGSGSTFPLGVTQVNCSVTDSGGLTTSGMFNVTVVDTTKPSLNLPSDKTVEATGPNGASVSYSASASDLVDGSVSVACTPSSGSTFDLGVTIVNCSATDAHGNTQTGSFNVAVVDTTAPNLSLPSNKTVEATGPNGANVSFSASASDIVDGSVLVLCDAQSGDPFRLGTTTVHCSATDSHNNSANGSFTVTVEDTTPPLLNLPNNITKEATGPNGATASWSASASDLVDGSVAVNCDASSGDIFPLGTTTVNCFASDSHSNSANGSFTVTVQDTTKPSLSLPGDITANAVNNQAVVTYSASANDVVDGSVAVNCSPASGSTFSIGSTTVNCSASDSHGNTATGTFNVNVVYRWSGFFQPVDNAAMNVAKSGSTIPVKFSLGGSQGLNVLAATPSVAKIGCSTGEPLDAIEQYTDSVASGLRYDSTADQYIYNWRTASSYAGTCQRLSVKLADDTVAHTADFKFTK